MRLLLPLFLLLASPAGAEVELSFYGGWRGAPDGGVTVPGPAGAPDVERGAGAALGDGAQFGLRGTWWGGSGFGVALDYSRVEGEGSGDPAIGRLDSVTVNGLRRWEDALGGATPYLGAGLGFAQAEVETAGESVETSGPALSWFAGASVPITDSLSVFGEYRGSYADTEGDTDAGASVGADPVTNSINVGVSFSF